MIAEELFRVDGVRRLAEAGCKFLPLSDKKIPCCKFRYAWTYPELIDRFMDGQLDDLPALAVLLVPSVLVLDIDSPMHGQLAGKENPVDGFASLRRWLEITGHGKIPQTLTAVSGTGGMHCYYRVDPDSPLKCGSRLGRETLGMDESGLDCKVGNAIAVLPGSLISGRMYRWRKDFPIAEASAAVLDLVRDRDGAGRRRPPHIRHYSGAEVPAEVTPPDDEMVEAMEELLLQLPCALVTLSEWVSVAGALKSYGYPFRLFDEWSQSDPTRYSDGRHPDTWTTWLSMADQPVEGGANIATVVALAKRYNENFRMPSVFVERLRRARIRQALAALDDDDD